MSKDRTTDNTRRSGFWGRRSAQRQQNRLEQRSTRPEKRRSEAGNVFFTLFGAVAVVGVLGAGIMATMRGPLSTMVEVNRIEEAKSVLRLNSRLVLQNATRGDSADANPPNTPPATAYCDDDAYSEAPDPVTCTDPVADGGCLPGNVGATRNDPWGVPYGYCAWNHGPERDSCGANTLAGADDTLHVAVAIISAGPDRQFNTTCDDLYDSDVLGSNNALGDDIAIRVTYNDAASMAGGSLEDGLWTAVGEDTAEIDRNLNVTSTATSTFGGNLALTQVGAVLNADVVAPVSGGDLVEIAADLLVSGDMDVGSALSNRNTTLYGTLDVTGATTISNTLTVSGANATTLGGTLGVTGATTISNTLTVSGANATTLGGTLTVSGHTDLDSTATIDGLLTVNNNVVVTGGIDVAGNITNIGGTAVTVDDDLIVNQDLLVNQDTTMNGNLLMSFDGSAPEFDVLTLNDGTSDVFTVDSEGNVMLAGFLDLGTGFMINGAPDAGMILVADEITGQFMPREMTGDVAIDEDGETLIQNNAVTTVKILDDAVTHEKIADSAVDIEHLNASASDGDLCLKSDGTDGLKFEICAGGTGPGGAYRFTDLNDTPDNYTGAANYIVTVNADGDRLVFTPVNELEGMNTDRLIDRAVSPALEGDTYIDVDVTDDGLSNSIVFHTNGVDRVIVQDNGQVDVAGSMTVDSTVFVVDAAGDQVSVGGNFAVDTNVLFVDATSNNVGLGTVAPVSSALLELSSITQGFLPPRMTTANRDTNITAPATGLLIFNTDAPGTSGVLQFWDGTEWVDVGGGGADVGLWRPNADYAYIEYDNDLGGIRVGNMEDLPLPDVDWLLNRPDSILYTMRRVAIGSDTISDASGANTNVVLDLNGDIAAIEYCDADGANCFQASDVTTLVGGGDVAGHMIEDTGDGNTYISTDVGENDTLNTIVMATAGTQRVIVDATGDVGIGTMADPGYRLHVQENRDAATSIGVQNMDVGAGAIADMLLGTDAGNLMFGQSSVAGGGSSFITSSAQAGLGITSQHATAGGIVFNTGAVPASRMFINPNGLIGVGNTNPQTMLDVSGTLRIGSGPELCDAVTHEGAIIYVAANDTFQVCADSTVGWEDLFSSGGGSGSELWTDLGAGRIHYGDDGSQRVGVATNNPLTALDVNGGVRVGSVSAQAPTYMALNSLSNVNTSPADGDCLRYNLTSGIWESGECGGGSSFFDLTEVTPDDFTGAANYVVAVNAAGDALEFIDSSNLGALAGLSCNVNEIIRWDGTEWVCSAQVNVDGTFNLQFTEAEVSAAGWTSAAAVSPFGFALRGFSMSVTPMTATTLALTYTGQGNDNAFLAAFTLSGGTWTRVAGSELQINTGLTTGFTSVRLSDDTIALAAEGGAGFDLRAYRWNGTTWTLINTLSTAWGYGSITRMDDGTIVLYDLGNETMRRVSWNGTTFTALSSTSIPLADNWNVKVAAISTNTIVFYESDFNGAGDDRFRVFSWNGATWVQQGADYTLPQNYPQWLYPVFSPAENMITTRHNTTFYNFLWNGTTWTQVSANNVGHDADNAAMLDADTAIFVYSGNGIYTYDFSLSGNPATITDVDATGNLGTLLSNGTRFQISRTANNNEVFTVVSMPDVNTVYVTGSVTNEGPVEADISLFGESLIQLSDLGDVNLSTLEEGQCLVYHNASGEWRNGVCYDDSGSTPDVGAIDDLSDAATDYANNNFFMGQAAGASISTGQNNFAIGQNAGDAITTGGQNMAIGFNALTAAQAVIRNTAIGYRAAASNNASNYVTAIGANAARLYNPPNEWNAITAIGMAAAENVTEGFSLVAIGHEALNNYPGSRNIAVGGTALFASNGGGGNDNTAVGSGAGMYMSGERNSILGSEAFRGGFSGDFDHRGNDSVYIGFASAMNATGNDNNQNVFIGSATGGSLRDGANNILIGYGVDVTSGTAANQLNIGNTIYGNLANDFIGIGVVAPQVALDVNGSIQYTGVLTDVSDMRLKTDITPLETDTIVARLMQISTYSYRMKDDPEGALEYGVMAQELEKIFPELVETAKDERGTKSVNYIGLIAPVIETAKALKAENEALKAEISTMKEQQGEIAATLAALQDDMQGMKAHTGYGIQRGESLALIFLLLCLGGYGCFLFVQRKRSV